MDVLIIDDDASVRAAYARVLAAAGFRVTEAGSAHDALREIHRRDFKAVVCDFVLPATEGTTLYQTLSEAAPAVARRVIFVTGWTGDPKASRLLEHSGRPVLTKPVEAADLVDAVRRAVQGT